LLFRSLKLPKGASLLTLRHTHGSHLLAAGVPLTDVSKRLGHVNPHVTATVYAHTHFFCIITMVCVALCVKRFARSQSGLAGMGVAEIVSMWRFTRNNGITEGFHNKVELINRQAYGFRNFQSYRLRVRVLCF
jgi:hypothetical protein